MEKRIYIVPKTIKNHLEIENLMLITSPGVGGDYDPNLPIDSKEFDFFDEEGSEMETKDSYQLYWDY
ncbi:hypothetical protein [Prevotella falsenii]|uniref:hypothetical protein n=1 Tax=Prevotella falsenii TaxID=515414 RepID=UPI00046A4FD7|nr:hypothetical protein [Prevotella falsenii]